MTAPRAMAALSILVALAILSRCASGGAKSAPSGTPEPSAATSEPLPEVAPQASGAPMAAAPPPAEPAATPAEGPGLPGQVDFTAQILPLLQEKCSPCHFPGGRMYDRLPFDQEGTIRELGTQMLSRLRDPLDQELIRTYLKQP